MWKIWNDEKGMEEMKGGILWMKRVMECVEEKWNVEVDAGGRYVRVC